jgi:hypothetical protein
METCVRRAAISTMVFLATVGGVASGATKTTPSLQKEGGDAFVCRVVNAGPSSLADVTVTILGSNGATLASQTLNSPAGWTGSVDYIAGATIGYCKVEGSFSKSKVHVTFCVVPSGSARCGVAVGDPGLK